MNATLGPWGSFAQAELNDGLSQRLGWLPLHEGHVDFPLILINNGNMIYSLTSLLSISMIYGFARESDVEFS